MLLYSIALAGCSTSTTPTTAGIRPNAPGKAPETANAQPAYENSTAIDESATTLRFTLMGDETGVRHTFRHDLKTRRHSILESVGGGGAMFDYDRDGVLDLVFGGGGFYGPKKTLLGHPCNLFRGRGNWKFEHVSQQAGGGFPAERFGHGTHAADYDNDGFLDFVACGFGGLEFWHNLGDGTFEEIHESAGLLDKMWSTCVGWGDFNGDRFLDMYVVHYGNWSLDNDPLCPAAVPGERESCPPKEFKGLPHLLYMANGDGTFRDVSREAGLRIDPKLPDGREEKLGKGLGVLVNDFDLDGDQDIYVANDTDSNYLYVNDGTGHFTEDGAVRGVATDDFGIPNGSMGVDVGDFNRDGLPDIWVANYQHEANALYRNDGDGQFIHVSRSLGITAVGGMYVGFGTVFADLNRDGFEDIVVNNGHVQFFPSDGSIEQEPLVQINVRGERFRRQNLHSDAYFGKKHRGRGLAAGDLDNDGDIDFCFINNEEPVALVRNDSVDDGQWLRARLVGTKSNRDGIGAALTLHTDQGDILRLVKGGSSFVSHCDLRATWGIPKEAQLSGLTITWPSGLKQEVEVTEAGQELTIVEPTS